MGGVNGEVRLSREEVIRMQIGLLDAFSQEEFQKRLHTAWDAAEGDPVKQVNERRRVCLEIQGPLIARFGFEQSWAGLMKSVAACNLVTPHEVHDYSSLIGFRAILINWLGDPKKQCELPWEWSEVQKW